MTDPAPHKAPLHRLLWLLVATSVLADQLSKAWFVYRLGTHQQPGFLPFLGEYFTLWGELNGTAAVTAHYEPFQPYIPVWEPWIRFTLATNSGAAWSILEGNSFLLSFVSLTMVLLLYLLWRKSFQHHPGMTLALGAIIGGALGNFADRFRMKEVVDFIAVKIPYIGKLFPVLGDPYNFPIFNIADSCACCGTFALAVYLIVADIRGWGRHKPKPAPAVQASPWQPAFDVTPEALAQLKLEAAQAPRYTTLGLTRHISLPGGGDDIQAPGAPVEERTADGG